MNFSEKNILEQEKKIFSPKHRFITRLRLDALFLCLLVVLAILVILAVCAAKVVTGVIQNAPQVGEKELLYSEETTVLYNQEGEETVTLDGSNIQRNYVTFDKIPEQVRNVFIAADDTGYYSHQGVDIKGVLQKLFGDTQSEEDTDSQRTLTQKLIRNQIYVDESDNSFMGQLTRMIQEQYLAVKLEEDAGKDKILEYYLNTLYFGGNRIGLDSASRYYFDKSPKDLNISEASVLAAVAQDPDKYDPKMYQSANSKKRADILNSTLNMESITEDEYEDALGDNVYLSLHITDKGNTSESETQDAYTEAVIAQVISDLKEEAGYSATQAYHTVYQGGVRIYTCLDGEIQKVCQKTVKKRLNEQEKAGASCVFMEQSTGEVKALVEEGKQSTQNGTGLVYGEEVRAAGDILPVLSVWLPAIDTAGRTLGSVVDDTSDTVSQDKTGDADAEYQGLVSIRESMLERLTGAAVQTLEDIDVQTGYDYLKRLGISTLVDKQEDAKGNIVSDSDLSLAKGELVQGVTNLELTGAYAALANAGKSVKPLFYTKLVDGNGEVLLENQKEETQIMKDSSAWLLTDVLSEYVSSGDGTLAGLGDDIAAAGISGSAAEGDGTWFEGYTPYYTAGIWYRDDGQTTAQKEKQCQSLWKSIMKKTHEIKKMTGAEFTRPSDIIRRTICTKCGNLGVEGLCDEALGGNCLKQEYFVSGTQPDTICTCHVKYRICQVSKKTATEKCPQKEVEEIVYLVKEEEVTTKDSRYVFSRKQAKASCDKHKE